MVAFQRHWDRVFTDWHGYWEVSEDTLGGYTKYVVPGDVANSSLYDKIANDPPNSGGSVMPGSGMMLAPSEIELVESWIASGALNN